MYPVFPVRPSADTPETFRGLVDFVGKVARHEHKSFEAFVDAAQETARKSRHSCGRRRLCVLHRRPCAREKVSAATEVHVLLYLHGDLFLVHR